MVSIIETGAIKSPEDLSPVPLVLKASGKYFLIVIDDHDQYSLIDLDTGGIIKDHRTLNGILDYFGSSRNEIIVYQDSTIQVSNGVHVI